MKMALTKHIMHGYPIVRIGTSLPYLSQRCKVDLLTFKKCIASLRFNNCSIFFAYIFYDSFRIIYDVLKLVCRNINTHQRIFNAITYYNLVLFINGCNFQNSIISFYYLSFIFPNRMIKMIIFLIF